MSVEELDALPAATIFERFEVLVTPKDVEEQMVTFYDDEGKTHTLPLTASAQPGDTIRIPRAVRGFVSPQCRECIMMWRGQDGYTWAPTVVADYSGNPILAKRYFPL